MFKRKENLPPLPRFESSTTQLVTYSLSGMLSPVEGFLYGQDISGAVNARALQ
jgi:hypothetical protein